jgi:hypothetical protein
MVFGAGISKLQGIIAFLLLCAVPVTAHAQQVEEAQPAPVSQDQSPEVAPANADLVEPPAQTQPIDTTPVVTPPTVKPVILTPAPKPSRKAAVDALKPGQFIWVKQDVYEGPMKIVVVLDTQRIYVFRMKNSLVSAPFRRGKKARKRRPAFLTFYRKMWITNLTFIATHPCHSCSA